MISKGAKKCRYCGEWLEKPADIAVGEPAATTPAPDAEPEVAPAPVSDCDEYETEWEEPQSIFARPLTWVIAALAVVAIGVGVWLLVGKGHSEADYDALLLKVEKDKPLTSDDYDMMLDYLDDNTDWLKRTSGNGYEMTKKEERYLSMVFALMAADYTDELSKEQKKRLNALQKEVESALESIGSAAVADDEEVTTNKLVGYEVVDCVEEEEGDAPYAAVYVYSGSIGSKYPFVMELDLNSGTGRYRYTSTGNGNYINLKIYPQKFDYNSYMLDEVGSSGYFSIHISDNEYDLTGTFTNASGREMSVRATLSEIRS
ncbi:MAG: hypothetical protein K2F74_07020 [Muribaculaceae bacterium]|nr:hypothetical protein [Muribaculaceae bacterium]